MVKKNTIRLLTVNGVVLLLMSLTFVVCAGENVKQENSFIGLYKITNRQCHVSEAALADCNNTKFIEFVKGQFYGVKNNEIAIVMWRGEKGEELLYQARKITQLDSIDPASKYIVISASDSETESLVLDGGRVTEYSIKFSHAQKKNMPPTYINYTVKVVQRGLLPDFRMNYPGND